MPIVISERSNRHWFSYERALQIEPKSFWAWYKRAEVYRHLGNYAEALASYTRALILDSEDSYAWYNQGCCAAKLGEVSLAIECLQQAINLNKSDRQLAQTDPDFEQLRNTEQWLALFPSGE